MTYAEMIRKRARARRVALGVLAARHRAEFRRILEATCDAEGVDPPRKQLPYGYLTSTKASVPTRRVRPGRQTRSR